MAKAFDTWNVLPHGPVTELAENLRAVEGALPGMPLKRRMTVAMLSDGRLVIHNPIALEESEMAKLDAWGKPAYLVVPNGYHRLDSANFKRRYPDAKVVCPRGAKKKVEEVVPVDLGYDEVPADAAVSFEQLAGVNDAEGVLSVRSPDGVTLVFNDVLFNVPSLPGFTGFLMTLMGSTGGPKVTLVGRLLVVKDKPALRAHLERLAVPEVRRLIPGHGDVVQERAAEVLREVAGRLG
jgi:hypothetical protein